MEVESKSWVRVSGSSKREEISNEMRERVLERFGEIRKGKRKLKEED